MTNLEIIKYLATNNHTRLAEALNDIYWTGCLRDKTYAMGQSPTKEFDDFKKWLNNDAKKSGVWYKDELKEWSRAITSTPTIVATYDNLSVTIPIKDPDHMWNNNNEYDYKENK